MNGNGIKFQTEAYKGQSCCLLNTLYCIVPRLSDPCMLNLKGVTETEYIAGNVVDKGKELAIARIRRVMVQHQVEQALEYEDGEGPLYSKTSRI